MCHRTKVCHKTKNYLETSIICSCMVWATDGTLKYDGIQSVPVPLWALKSSDLHIHGDIIRLPCSAWP